MNSLYRYILGIGLALGLFASSYSSAQAFFGISIGIAPPPLPVYVQPACPGDGYIWTPGYWAWDSDDQDYYWVPGSWVLAPEYGLLWTPGWWGCSDGAYYFHRGYWGHDVGFYGGVNYGYGYDGHGYDGGHWHGNHFVYNRAVNNVANINHGYLYSHAVSANGSRVSFNGGAGGTRATATAEEQRAAGEHHFSATSAQNALAHTAATDPSQRFHTNHGSPQVTATQRAGDFRSAHANAVTGESRTSAAGEPAFTGETRHTSATGESASTGQTHQASAEQRRTEVADEQRRATETRTAQAQRTAEAEHSQAGESHLFAEPSHTSSYRPNESHTPEAHISHPSFGGGGGGAFHPSVSHSGGGGGFHPSAGGGAAHASFGGGGGGGHSGGGGHAGGGGGGHSGGGNHH